MRDMTKAIANRRIATVSDQLTTLDYYLISTRTQCSIEFYKTAVHLMFNGVIMTYEVQQMRMRAWGQT